MQIKLNNSLVNIEGEMDTIADLVTLVKKQYLAPPLPVVTGIIVDGKEMDISMSDSKISTSSSIKVFTELPRTLAANSINNLKEHISHTLPMLEKAADKFRTEGEEEANKYYAECLDALQLFSEVMDGVGQMLDLDYSRIVTDKGNNINEEIDVIRKLFEAMHEAQKQKDWVLLADVIEYELVPVMKTWPGFFTPILIDIEKTDKN